MSDNSWPKQSLGFGAFYFSYYSFVGVFPTFVSLYLAFRGISAFEIGILMSLIVLRRGNLWGACALHSLWNFAQGNLFGIRVSGLSAGPSPFLSFLSPDMPLWNGSQYGLEASLPVTLCLLLAVGAVGAIRPRGIAPNPI